MNIKEMHIQIRQDLQRLDASAVDYFQPEEIDLAINKEVGKFIKTHFEPNGNKYKEGFEQSIKRIEDLRHLIVPDYTDTAFIDGFDDSVVKMLLPPDHLFLTRVRPTVLYNECEGEIEKSSSINSYSYAVVSLSFLNNIDQITNFDLEVTDSGGSKQSIVSNNYKNNEVGVFRFPEDRQDFIDSLIEDIEDKNNLTFRAYQEGYKNTWKNGSLIVLIRDSDQNVELTVEDSTNSYTLNKAYSNNSDSFFTWGYDGPEGAKLKTRRGVFSQLSDIDTLLDDPHNTTRPERPLFTVRSHYVDIYLDEDFIVNQAAIDYIRRPKRVSYSRGIDLELASHTHDEIVASTVSHLSGVIADQRYKYLESEAQSAE